MVNSPQNIKKLRLFVLKLRLKQHISMGLVVLQLGQAGNQLGLSFFNCLATSGIPAQSHGEFFRESEDQTRLIARALLIDMEPKVSRVS